MEMINSYFNVPWRAAHRHLITDRELQDIYIPEVCEELRAHLPGRGEGPSWLSLGAVAMLVNGTAILLQQKAKQTLEDTFELTQKIMLKNYQTGSEKRGTKYKFEMEDTESEEDVDSRGVVSSGTSVPTPSKRFADAMDDLEMSKRIRSRESTESESNSGEDGCSPHHRAASSSSLENVAGVTDEENDDLPANGNENIWNGVRDQTADACRCLSAQHAAGGRGHRVGVMLIFDTCDRAVPSKLVVSSIHPAAKF